MTSDKAGASVGWAASRMQLFMTSAQQTNPEYTLVATPPLPRKGNTGIRLCGKSDPDVAAAITSSCKNVELAAKAWMRLFEAAITCSTSVLKAFL
ncbi:MAG: hypothetical protein ACLVAW_12225 [Eisenbergiella massiliensis]